VSYQLRIAPAAESQIRDAARWWLSNRPKAPDAFAEDLEKAFGLISALPGAGEAVQHPRVNGLRRLLMGRVRYYLYYQATDESETVEILALWHTSRRGSPALG